MKSQKNTNRGMKTHAEAMLIRDLNKNSTGEIVSPNKVPER
jgi:hypothetical protein